MKRWTFGVSAGGKVIIGAFRGHEFSACGGSYDNSEHVYETVLTFMPSWMMKSFAWYSQLHLMLVLGGNVTLLSINVQT